MVKSADRVVKILEYVGRKGEGYTHREIASTLMIPKSSLTALLANLIETEYLTYEPATKRYSLGPQLLFLAGRYLDSLDIVSLGQSFVKKLCMLTHESVALAIPNGYDALFVYKENSVQPIMRSLEIGSRLPMYATAAGKAILAFFPGEFIDNYLDSITMEHITENTVTNRDRILEELESIRNGGLAYSREAFQDGVSAFGRPVLNVSGKAVASLTVNAPSFRVQGDVEPAIEKHVKDVAEELSHRLGYSGRPPRCGG